MVNKYFFLYILIIVNNTNLSLSSCQVGIKNCTKCDPITQLCLRCDKNILSPDEKGGCVPSEKCVLGNNYCIECNEDQKTCKTCESGLFPDDNGACSFVNNCEISFKGKCLKCRENFKLVGYEFGNTGFLLCKSLALEEFQNCANIDSISGYCTICQEGYFLSDGDKKCTKIENCNESSFGICKKCNNGYYLDKKDNKCKIQSGIFLNCQETIDGEACDLCNDDYYFTEEGNCLLVNYCSKGVNYKCEQCISGYYLTKDKLSCTNEQNCYNGDANNGLCNLCIDNYYIDFVDRKCKSNQENNEFKYCKRAENHFCVNCINEYILGKDSQCTKTNNCEEADNGLCISCIDKYYLDLDNRCTQTEHCIHSTSYYQCEECEDGYFFNYTSKTCLKTQARFENCKSTDYGGNYCNKCKTNFYINQTDHLCYSNKEKNDLYKCTQLDLSGEFCVSCENEYYYGIKDHKCSLIEGCDRSENENKCLECDEYHCLDLKNGKCEDNTQIESEEKKIFFRCQRTNEEGDKCEICLNGLILNEEGLCIETEHCSKEVDGICKKCENNMINTYCLNSKFGCVETFYLDCLECDDYLDFSKCTKCKDGYILNENYECIDIE